jgi:aerobic-type carbon monoxide dehydrogenase small subunit (CoxS/CutS family)
MGQITELNVNGEVRKLDADGERSLLSILRDDLDLTGTKYGCGEGQCGACTVLIDGTPTRTCITSVAKVAGKRITTIEAIAPKGQLHPVQRAFLQEGALQCAYCTSGMIIGAVALLERFPSPTEEQIISGMNRHICRCGAYQRIVKAIKTASTLK